MLGARGSATPASPIYFADKTHLNFALEPRLSVRAGLSDWQTGDGRGIKTWPVMMSESSYIDD